jgi:catechol 2,3-dioxygenase-like lactoylglutathione lyase family enzyme
MLNTSIRVSHVCLWVHDQEEALAFYTEKLGFEVQVDNSALGFRWLTVASPAQPDLELTLLVPGPPALSPDTVDQIVEVMSKGVIGGLIFAVDDCHKAYEELRARGVEFTEEPTERYYGIDAAFRDPSGNAFRLTQHTLAREPA